MSSHVLFETVNNNGLITLNRESSLNGLCISMMESLVDTLLQWINENRNLVVIKSNSKKAFCAGGDVNDMIREGERSFRVGYQLIGIIGTYKIPYISLIDGIVMGGGVGISINGRYRVCTERTVFAMPETTIGFFPDVAASFFLPRLEGKLGYFLSLTATRLKGKDVFKAGIATHYVESKNMGALEEALLACSGTLQIEEILKRFSIVDKDELSLRPIMPKINHCFNGKTIEEIVENLRIDGSEWASVTLKKMLALPPTSLKVTLRSLNLGSNMNILDCLKMEFRLAINFLKNSDMHHGVNAFLNKTKRPKWNPSTIQEVSDEYVLSFFEPPTNIKELCHKL